MFSTVGDAYAFQSTIRNFTLLGQKAAVIGMERANPTPGANQGDLTRFIANAPKAPRLYYQRERTYLTDLFNQEGARKATASAQAARSKSLGGKPSSSGAGRGQSLLMSMLGLLGEANTTRGSLGGGA
jgi:hypothetical protein